MTTVTIQTVVKGLNVPMRGLATNAQLKAWSLGPGALKKLPQCDDDLARYSIKLANAVPYQVMRTASCVCLDLLANEDMPSQIDLEHLLSFLLENDIDANMKWTERLDVGIVLYALRENGKMHSWHGHKYKDALRDTVFVCQANALVRMRSGRETAWIARMDQRGTASLAMSQVKFAELTQSVAMRRLSMPLRTASNDKWIAFLYEVAAVWGKHAMKRLGYDDGDAKKIGTDFKTQVHDRIVGQDVGTGVLKTYLQVASTIPFDSAIVGSILPHAVGMEAVFDTFLLTEKRWVCKTTEEILELFCACSLDDFVYAFDNAFASFGDPRHMPIERLDADRNANLLIEEEANQQERMKVKNQKLRDKRRRRKMKSKIVCDVDLTDVCVDWSSSDGSISESNDAQAIKVEESQTTRRASSDEKALPSQARGYGVEGVVGATPEALHLGIASPRFSSYIVDDYELKDQVESILRELGGTDPFALAN